MSEPLQVCHVSVINFSGEALLWRRVAKASRRHDLITRFYPIHLSAITHDCFNYIVLVLHFAISQGWFIPIKHYPLTYATQRSSCWRHVSFHVGNWKLMCTKRLAMTIGSSKIFQYLNTLLRKKLPELYLIHVCTFLKLSTNVIPIPLFRTELFDNLVKQNSSVV
jgi:hypothetical protein